MERIWLWLRERFLSLRTFPGSADIRDASCDEWNALAGDANRIPAGCLQTWIKKVIP